MSNLGQKLYSFWISGLELIREVRKCDVIERWLKRKNGQGRVS